MKLDRTSLAAVVLVASADAAAAHVGGIPGGFASGFFHPLLGWDHVAAMVAVGMWGAFLGRPALWLLPIVFPMVMAFGAAPVPDGPRHITPARKAVPTKAITAPVPRTT